MNLGPDGGSHKFSHSEIIRLMEECFVMSRAPTSLYQSLETLSVRAGLMKESALGVGPGTKKLANQIAEASVVLEDVIVGILSQLYAQAVSLTVTITGSVARQGIKE